MIDDVEVLKINCLFYIWLKGICSHDDISILIPNVYLINPLDHCIVFRIRYKRHRFEMDTWNNFQYLPCWF